MQTMDGSIQWLFSLSSLRNTPTELPIEKEMYDRARGVEFLFRLGTSLQLPTAAMLTAATWFHRFYMRHAMGDFHRQDVAAACVFLSTKTEECGRKLRDVAKVYHAKATNTDTKTSIHNGPQEVEKIGLDILHTEEYLLEALCFDFLIQNPHNDLIDLFDEAQSDPDLQDYAWSIAHDSYRTPLCILFPPRIIAAACYILAQAAADDPSASSLDSRLAITAPSSTLPTPPTHKARSPDASRYVIEHYALTPAEVQDVTDAIDILLEFYRCQDEEFAPHVHLVSRIPAPKLATPREPIYRPWPEVAMYTRPSASEPAASKAITPSSSHGGHTPQNIQESTRMDLS
ncbi:cyclin-like protein [Schizophyllum amplum]|uniref:Cyclin-like protein n=1 Tax=Schizophyllum amplum TaxID=97359 RepID=A0A550C3I3_9AGAR|nr:cyclin-like protein [Auriculariopsis ampla]